MGGWDGGYKVRVEIRYDDQGWIGYNLCNDTCGACFSCFIKEFNFFILKKIIFLKRYF